MTFWFGHFVPKLSTHPLILIVVVIQEINEIKKLKKKNEQMVFASISRIVVHINKETLAYMEYLTEKYVWIIEFSYADKNWFLYR